jgi:hypothetical protein
LLNEAGQSVYPAELRYQVMPDEYHSSSTEVLFFEDGLLWDTVVGTTRSGNGVGRIPRGAGFEIDKLYETQLVLNRGAGRLEIRSDRAPLAIQQKIIKDYSRDFDISQDVDLLNQRVCTLGSSFEFTLNQPGRITLTFISQDNRNARTVVIDDRPFDVGIHRVPILPDELAPGAYRFELAAISDRDGHQELERGMARSQRQLRDSLPVGHVMVKGVDVSDGHMVLGSADLSIPGRGAALEFRRTYSSNTGYGPGVMGLRWSHNYESRIAITPCGEAIVKARACGLWKTVTADCGRSRAITVRWLAMRQIARSTFSARMARATTIG